MNSLHLLLLITFFWLAYRILEWRQRVSRVRRTMPVVPLILNPYSLLRLMFPRKWQAYHADWQFQELRNFNNLGTDMVPLICLFGFDMIYVSDADAVVEIAMNINRFPKDLKLYSTDPLLLSFW